MTAPTNLVSTVAKTLSWIATRRCTREVVKNGVTYRVTTLSSKEFNKMADQNFQTLLQKHVKPLPSDTLSRITKKS